MSSERSVVDMLASSDDPSLQGSYHPSPCRSSPYNYLNVRAVFRGTTTVLSVSLLALGGSRRRRTQIWAPKSGVTRRLLPLLLTIHTKHAYCGEVYTAHGINGREAIAVDSTSTTPRTCLASIFLYLRVDDGDLARTYSSSDVRTFGGVCMW